MRKELSDGHWVELREVDDLREGDRMAMNRAVMLTLDKEGNQALPGNYLDDMRAAMYKRIITNWSFPLALPGKDSRVLAQLTLKQGRELREATEEYMKELAVEVNPEKADTDPTEDSLSYESTSPGSQPLIKT